ncbi:MAG: rhodanese-like domain-containing protein [Pseudomonadota bacterium]
MRRLCAGLLFLPTLGGCAEPPYTSVNNTELKALLAQGVPIYDIRRPDEWRQTGVVQGSQKLTLVDEGSHVDPEFYTTLTKRVRRDQPDIVICRSGRRSSTLVRELMERQGYTHVYNVKQGVTGWITQANSVVHN